MRLIVSFFLFISANTLSGQGEQSYLVSVNPVNGEVSSLSNPLDIGWEFFHYSAIDQDAGHYSFFTDSLITLNISNGEILSSVASTGMFDAGSPLRVFDYGNGEDIAIVRWNGQESGYEFLIQNKWESIPAIEQLFLDGVNNTLYEFAFDPTSKILHCLEADGLLLVPIDFSSGDVQNAIEINNQVGPVGDLHWHQTEGKLYCLQGDFEIGGYYVSTLDHETGTLQTMGQNISIDWESESTWVSYLDEVNNRMIFSAFNFEENSRIITLDLETGELLSDVILIEHDPNDLFDMQDRFTNPIYSNTTDAVIGIYYGDGSLLTGIKEHEKTGFQLYPNPCSHSFNIDTGSNSIIESMRVVDLEGKLSLELFNLSPNSPISIGSLSPGVYTLRLIQDGQILNQKLIIE